MMYRALCVVFLLSISNLVYSAPLGFWDVEGWTQIADDDGVGQNGFVNPGWGGQGFDAEYLYYKTEGSILSIGLQTGFDVLDGKYRYNRKNYYSGDLALSFDNDSSSYEYGIDFGLFTRDFYGRRVDAGNDRSGVDAAGVYAVSDWNNNIEFPQAAPFAITDGTLVSGLLSNSAGKSGSSYFRTVSFDLSTMDIDQSWSVDLHWTMSCGNDFIEGNIATDVPEPGSLILLFLGTAILVLGYRLRHRQQS